MHLGLPKFSDQQQSCMEVTNLAGWAYYLSPKVLANSYVVTPGGGGRVITLSVYPFVCVCWFEDTEMSSLSRVGKYTMYTCHVRVRNKTSAYLTSESGSSKS